MEQVSKQIMLRLTNEVYRVLKKESEQNGISVGEKIKIILSDYFQNKAGK